jgi:hypothetical protein
MTRIDLIKVIKKKVKRAKPIVKRHFYRLLERSNKTDLERILRNVHVSRDGYDIKTGLG